MISRLHQFLRAEMLGRLLLPVLRVPRLLQKDSNTECLRFHWLIFKEVMRIMLSERFV
ncbi:hypothetical protein Goari_025347 [Gossypium aridum]|uniref:Uncharacterized protein n=1 Tax=Gossypium aridum TaxID=34290 RepID=A0A7J8X8W0_GOSAI|nr:hypothetical protein [Gossypium aridum]